MADDGRVNLITENEMLSLRVDSTDGHLRMTRDNGDIVDAGSVLAPETLTARDEAVQAASDAAASAAAAEAVPTTTDGLVKSLLDDAGSATSAALAGTFASIPGQEMRTARAAYARRDMDVLVIGDSISEGTGTSLIEKRYASVLRDQLRSALGLPVGGRGYVPSMYAVNPATSDELWVLSGGASQFILTYGLGKRAVRLNASGHKATLTVPKGHTDVDLLITCSSSIVSWYTPTVDGVTGANVNVQAVSSGTLRDVVINVASGLDPASTHTIEVAWATGNVYLSGAMLYAAGEKAGGAGSGVRLWDGSHHGVGSEYFATTTDPWNYTINTIQPDLVVIALGRNNWSAGNRTPAQVATDIDTLIGSVMAQTTIDPSILVLPVYGNKAGGVPVAPWSDYVAAQKTIAESHGAGFLDLSRTVGTITDAASNALGILNADLVHPTDLGAQMIADELNGVVVP